MLRIHRAVGQYVLPEPADGGGHDVHLIIDFTGVVQALILQNDRNIIHAPAFWDLQQVTAFIFDQHQPGEPHRHLITAGLMRMRVEPAGRCGLIKLQTDFAILAGFD
ncbi:hypothetical protein SRABI106_04858 [Rahnella aquatilis]|nr:hypothetical protein SRABI106_04858 [Rahnella aquatilis]